MPSRQEGVSLETLVDARHKDHRSSGKIIRAVLPGGPTLSVRDTFAVPLMTAGGMQRELRSQDNSCLRCSDGDCRWVETFGDQPDAEEYFK